MNSNADTGKRIFSSRLASLIQKKNIKQNELASVLNVSESTVGKWILMKSMPRMGTIQKIADYFCVKKSYLLEENARLDANDLRLVDILRKLQAHINEAIEAAISEAMQSEETFTPEEERAYEKVRRIKNRRTEKESQKSEAV